MVLLDEVTRRGMSFNIFNGVCKINRLRTNMWWPTLIFFSSFSNRHYYIYSFPNFREVSE